MTRPQEAYLEYKNNPGKEKELQIIQEAMADTSKDAIIHWKFAFAPAYDVYLSLLLADMENLCIKSLKDVKSVENAVQSALIKQCAMTAWAAEKNWKEACFSLGKEDRYDEMKELWSNHFARYPGFDIAFQKQKARSQGYHTTLDQNELNVATSYVFNVPLTALTDNMPQTLDNQSPAANYILSSIQRQPITLGQFVNDFFVSEHFDIRDGQLQIEFKSKSILTDNELIDATEKLNGQLSDGWGENLQNRRVLIGQHELTYQFGAASYSPDTCSTLKPQPVKSTSILEFKHPVKTNNS